MQHYTWEIPQRLRYIKNFSYFLNQLDCENTKVAWKHFHHHFLLENAARFVCFHKPFPVYIYVSTCTVLYFTGNHSISLLI